MSQPDVRLNLPARPENVAVVRQALAGLADAYEVPPALAADMKIAVTEACTNAVLHAYAETDAGPLEVCMTTHGARLSVSVRDQGLGFKPLPAGQDMPQLGFGLALIASLTDAFGIQGSAAGTEVRMTFDLAVDGVNGSPVGGMEPLSPEVPDTNGAVKAALRTGPGCAPVLARVTSLLAARADLSLDRLSDAQLVSDAIAQHAPAEAVDGTASASFVEGQRTLAMEVGPLRDGGAERLVAATRLPGLGKLLEQLASRAAVTRRDGGEYLELELAEAAEA